MYIDETTEHYVTTLTLTQGARLNPLSLGMIEALQERLDALADDPRTRVIILRGEGKVFSAGHDLKEMQAARAAPDKGAAGFADLFERCATLMMTIRQQPQPVIAQVHGIATAAGCQLAATCDMVVAAETARFGVNGVNIGLFCSTPMVALSRAIPRKAAFEMLTTGRFISASEAQQLGLVNRIVPETELGAATQDLAQSVAGKLGAAVRIGKRVFYEQAEMTTQEAYAFAGAAMIENTLLPETDEGIDAFLNKRPPSWSPKS